MAAGACAVHDCRVLVTDLPTSRTPDVRRRARQEPSAIWSAPSHGERAEVALAIDRWNNEGGFVPDLDAGLHRWLRERRSRPDS